MSVRLKRIIFIIISILILSISYSYALEISDDLVELDTGNGNITIICHKNYIVVKQNGENKYTTKGCKLIQSSTARIDSSVSVSAYGDSTLKTQLMLSSINIYGKVNITSNASVQFLLDGENKIYYKDYIAVNVDKGCVADFDGAGSLRVDGVLGGGQQFGTINFNSGKIKVYSGYNGSAAIGSFYSSFTSFEGTININGGEIYAYSYSLGAAIGSGCSKNGNPLQNSIEININGGTVSAINTSKSQCCSAAIGGGGSDEGIGASGGIINIRGGYIHAEANSAVGIGGGGYVINEDHSVVGASSGIINISGGEIYGSIGSYNGVIDYLKISNAYITGNIVGKGDELVIKNTVITGSSISSFRNIDIDYDNCTINVPDICMSFYFMDDENYSKPVYTHDLSGFLCPSGSAFELNSNITAFGGASYQWAVKYYGSDEFINLDGETNSELKTIMKSEYDGATFRCRVTTKTGNVLSVETTKRMGVLKFTGCGDSLAEIGESVQLSISKTGYWQQDNCYDVTYKWEESEDNIGIWTVIGTSSTPTYNVIASVNNNGNKYRCTVYDNNNPNAVYTSYLGELIVDVSEETTYRTNYIKERETDILIDRDVIESQSGSNVVASEKQIPGWFIDYDKSVLSGIVQEDSSLILSVYYKPEEYTIHFNSNGGTKYIDIDTYFDDEIYVEIPTRAGYKFVAWYYDASLKNIALSREDIGNNIKFTFIESDNNVITLYAKWLPDTDDSKIKYSINTISLNDMEFSDLSSIRGGEINIKIDVINVSSYSSDELFTAVYGYNGKMIQTYRIVINSSDYIFNEINSYSLKLNNDRGDIKSIKAFIIPSSGNIIPLTNSVGLF